MAIRGNISGSDWAAEYVAIPISAKMVNIKIDHEKVSKGKK